MNINLFIVASSILAMSLCKTAYGQSSNSDCFDDPDVLGDTIVEQLGDRFTAMSLYIDDEVEYVIFTGYDRQKEILWMIARQSSQSYCILGRGHIYEPLMSLHDVDTGGSHRYGMPGSGYPRCGLSNNIGDDLHVRVWANKELGESHTFYFTSTISPDYTLLFARDMHWILLNREDGGGTCYFARGYPLNIANMGFEDESTND